MKRKILILGQGSLGGSLYKAAKTSGYTASLVPIRTIAPLSSISIGQYDYVVDCMDPSHAGHADYASIQQLVTKIRRFAIQSVTSGRYCYISTVNLYVASSKLLTEDSPIVSSSDPHLPTYIYNKLRAEQMLATSLGSRLLRLRLPPLWSRYPLDDDQSFFADLVRSRLGHYFLPVGEGDKHVLTYLSYDDASLLILYCLKALPISTSIVNISSGIWSTRELLKRGIDKCTDTRTEGRRILSKYYNPSSLNLSLDVLL